AEHRKIEKGSFTDGPFVVPTARESGSTTCSVYPKVRNEFRIRFVTEKRRASKIGEHTSARGKQVVTAVFHRHETGSGCPCRMQLRVGQTAGIGTYASIRHPSGLPAKKPLSARLAKQSPLRHDAVAFKVDFVL